MLQLNRQNFNFCNMGRYVQKLIKNITENTQSKNPTQKVHLL